MSVQDRHWNGYDWVDGSDGRKGGWTQTSTGKRFWPLDPRPDEICIEDIAHHLSNLCRFGGAVSTFYSVGQHSLLVADQVPAPFKLSALLHDASEAYLIDFPRPLKHSPGFEAYKAAEAQLMEAVWDRFHLWDFPYADWETRCADAVERADQQLLATERRDLLGPECHWEVPDVEPLPDRILPLWPPRVVEDVFLQRFEQYSQSDGGF